MPLATHQDAVREYARNAGRESADQAWILSPYDTWERNPFYAGPPARHPEDDSDYSDYSDYSGGGNVDDEPDWDPYV